MDFKTLEWIGEVDGCLEMIDQRLLPAEFKKLSCHTVEQLHEAIKTLAIRGAPAIGVAAAFGICIAAKEIKADTTVVEALDYLGDRADYLATARPTAVNLFWALDRMKAEAKQFAVNHSTATADELKAELLRQARAIYDEDVRMCGQISVNGEKFIKAGAGILTHCNAGALATAGMGTALAPMFKAHQEERKFTVYADETRPLLQGARLTAWELQQAGIDVVVICDNMAATLMKQGKIDACITGADRIAANGDAANKIGTYGLSILAKHHGIPFYIAAPSSTFDLSIETGREIPIEQRDADEVRMFRGSQSAPADASVYNPAFDVTEAGDITAIITEKGVIEKPNTKKIAEHLR